MNVIELNFNEWELVVDLNGGKIDSLKNRGVLLFGSFERIDGKKGNTYISMSGFYNEELTGDTIWTLVQKTENTIEISLEKLGVGIHQIFSFNNDYFIQRIVLENKSEEEKQINMAIHNYWSSELGWQGLMFNGMDLSLGIKQNDFINLRQLNEVDIPGKPLIRWQLAGFNYAKLWTGFLAEGQNKIFDNNYVCIVPIMGKDDNSLEVVLPKMKKEVRQMIGVVYRT